MTTDHIPGKNGGRLRRIPKGVSGNPKGRPKKLPELDKLLADVLGEEKDGLTAAAAILKALRMKATRGDVRAAEVLLDRAYGKAKETMEVNGELRHSAPSVTIQVLPPTVTVPTKGDGR